LAALDERTFLQVFEGVPQAQISKSDLEATANIVDLLSETTGNEIFPSKGEARKMIQGGGVSINKEKITDPQQVPNFPLLQGKYLLVQKGKKNYFIISVK
jgi:tyrosyl-tRNA synthetase